MKQRLNTDIDRIPTVDQLSEYLTILEVAFTKANVLLNLDADIFVIAYDVLMKIDLIGKFPNPGTNHHTSILLAFYQQLIVERQKIIVEIISPPPQNILEFVLTVQKKLEPYEAMPRYGKELYPLIIETFGMMCKKKSYYLFDYLRKLGEISNIVKLLQDELTYRNVYFQQDVDANEILVEDWFITLCFCC